MVRPSAHRSGFGTRYATWMAMVILALCVTACGPGGPSLTPSDVQTIGEVLKIPGAVCSALDGTKIPGYVRVGCKILTAVDSVVSPQGLDGTPAVAERRVTLEIYQVREDVAEEFLRTNSGP